MMFAKGVLLLLLLLAPVLDASSAHRPSPAEVALAKRRAGTESTKYFNEAGTSLELGHYDKRYFHGKVPYDQHRLVLRDLIRSYLTVCDAHGLETWLAHGTLLGWWWNGQVMPWDYDLDVQVANETLFVMADTLNRTEHVFNRTQTFAQEMSNETTTSTQATYLLDVNPHHVELTRGDWSNIIDARWIDMDNGMYIDITGLREREKRRPGDWSCKNKHRYATQDLWPLRVSEFEGVPARVPQAFQRILTEEYGDDSVVDTDFAK